MFTFAWLTVFKTEPKTRSPTTLCMKLKPRHLAVLFAFVCVTQLAHGQRIFWNEPNNNRIRFGALTYSSLSAGTNLLSGYSGISNLAFSPSLDVMFFTTNGGTYLYQANYNGSGAFEVYNYAPMSESTDIAYSANAGGVYASIYEEAQGIRFVLETSGISQSMNLGGRSGDVFSCITVDDGSERIFFYDETTESIGYSNFSDDGIVDIIGGVSGVRAIDYDEATDKIVFSNGANELWMHNGNGSGAFRLVSGSVNEITSVQYYSGYNKVYFVQNERIWSVNVDGTGLTNLLTLTGTGVTDLAVEFDQTIPTVSSRYPAEGQTGITIGETFTLDFSEQIRKCPDAGVGTQRQLRIIRTSDGQVVDTYDRDDTRLNFTGNTLTISGANYSGSNTDYHILIGNRVVEDMAGLNFTGFTLATQWNFTTGTFVDESKYYSRTSGDFSDENTWSHEGHNGPPVAFLPGTGADVEIGPGHVVTMSMNEGIVGDETGVVIKAGGTLDMNHHELNLWGELRIEGTLLNGGTLSGMWELWSTELPVFDKLSVGISGLPDQEATLHCNVVSYEQVELVDGGILNTNGFSVCTPPVTAHTPVYNYSTYDVISMTWTAPGAGNTLIVVREAGTAPVKPQFGTAYTANANFGDGAQTGTGNFVAYSGTGNSMTITGLSALHGYEIDMYGYTSTIGGCYSLNSYQSSSFNSCAEVDPPSGKQDSEYCSGDTKVPVVIFGADMVNWYDAPTGGNLVPGVVGDDGSGGITFLPTAASGTFYAAAVEYWEVVPANCMSSTRTAVTLTMRPALVPGTATGAHTICSGGDPTALTGGTASGGDGTYTYEWGVSTTSGGPYTNPAAPFTNANYDPAAGLTQTSYFVRTVTSGTCAPKTGNEIAVTVVNPPSITTHPQDRNICGSSATTFSVAATGTTLTYQWQIDNGSGFATLNNGGVYTGATTATLSISNATGLNGFKYRCVVTAAATCPMTSNAGTLTVSTAPVAVDKTIQECETIAGSGTANLNLTDYDVQITGGAASTTITWYDDDSYTSQVTTPTNVSATDGRLYYPRVTAANTCTDDAVLTIDIITAPEVTIHPDKVICSAAGTALNFTSSPTGATYAWTISTNANITGASNGSGTAINQTLHNTAATRQQVIYTIVPSLGGCEGPAFTQNVFVDPALTIFNVTGGGIFCTNGTPLTVGLSGSQNGLTYTLFKDGMSTARSIAGTGAALSFDDITAAGSYGISASTTANCSAQMTGTVAVTESSGPTGNGSIGGPSQMCLGQEETFTVTGITGATSYLWTLPAGVESVSSTTTATITVVIISEIAGVNLIATPFNDCGPGAPIQKPLSSLPVPNAQIIAPTEALQIGEPAMFEYSSSATVSGVFWFFGDGQTSEDDKPTVTYAAAGNYNVDLEVTDQNGCTNTVRESIVVSPEASLGDFAVKNVITPNGDGMNDFLYIENIDAFPDNEVILLDRWGSEVFRKKNYDNSFEMKKGDQYLPAGNYVCVLKANGKSYSRTVTVLKQN